MVSIKPCDCADDAVSRIERDLWMRLVFPARRLYRCSRCKARLLLSMQDAVERNHAAALKRTPSGVALGVMDGGAGGN